METLSAVSTLAYSEKDLWSFLISEAAEKSSALALWKLPGSDLKHAIISDRARLLDTDDLLEELEPGFMMAPFDKNKKRHFLPAGMLLTFENGKLRAPVTAEEDASAQWLRERLPIRLAAERSASVTMARPNANADTRAPFEKLVAECIEEIERGTFEKIVPSRSRTVTLPDSFDIATSFQKLCAIYPEALISFVNIPGCGIWLGASPEVLVGVRNKSTFRTVALAGTKPYLPGTDIKSVAWTQKEIEEQALVERYVISCFKKVRLREYEEHGPRTAVAGNLLHLKSEFTVDMKATNFPQIGSVMLSLLHPTSAVCGMPLDPSLEFLQRREGYGRGFYSGYLGPVNVNNDIDLFVNLRCMQITGKEATLYAGAGVTVDSDPEKEWAETEMKLNTLLNVIL
jgi:isochorismate synthase